MIILDRSLPAKSTKLTWKSLAQVTSEITHEEIMHGVLHPMTHLLARQVGTSLVLYNKWKWVLVIISND